MPRLLLINPSDTTQRGLGYTRAIAWQPLNLSYVAAMTPAHFDVELLDENVGPFAFRDASLAGITSVNVDSLGN